MPIDVINKQYADVTFKFYLLFHHTYQTIGVEPTILKKAKFFSWYCDMQNLIEKKVLKLNIKRNHTLNFLNY